MEQVLTNPRYNYGVRGNLFSFLLPWNHIQERLEYLDEDLTQWPLGPGEVTQVVRVRLQKGDEALVKECKELRVRAAVVRMMAFIYIEHHLDDLKFPLFHGLERPL